MMPEYEIHERISSPRPRGFACGALCLLALLLAAAGALALFRAGVSPYPAFAALPFLPMLARALCRRRVTVLNSLPLLLLSLLFCAALLLAMLCLTVRAEWLAQGYLFTPLQPLTRTLALLRTDADFRGLVLRGQALPAGLWQLLGSALSLALFLTPKRRTTHENEA